MACDSTRCSRRKHWSMCQALSLHSQGRWGNIHNPLTYSRMVGLRYQGPNEFVPCAHEYLNRHITCLQKNRTCWQNNGGSCKWILSFVEVMRIRHGSALLYRDRGMYIRRITSTGLRKHFLVVDEKLMDEKRCLKTWRVSSFRSSLVRVPIRVRGSKVPALHKQRGWSLRKIR